LWHKEIKKAGHPSPLPRVCRPLRTTDYIIRQPKPSDETIIPLNTAIQFTLDKNKMKFKVRRVGVSRADCLFGLQHRGIYCAES
jgi:hypothetical protein